MTTKQTPQSVYRASNAAGSCTEAEEAAGKSIVAKHADKRHTENGANSARNGSIETQQATRDGRFYLPSGFTRNCDHCGRPYIAKRDTSRFCSSVCRVAAHRARHEAGGGRVGLVIGLALLAAGLWFFWPLLRDIAAMRPTLQPTPTAVPAWPATWPQSPDPAPTAVYTWPTAVPQAMPDPAVTAVSPAPAIVTDDVKPAPTAVPQAAPATAVYIELPTAVPAQPQVAATAGAALLHITAGGKVYELTGERLIDCINAQQNGRRTGPSCPPNAAQYAGMLGQGR